MPKDISLKSDRGPSTVSRNPRDFALGVLRGGGEKLAQELMAAGMTAGVPYGPQLGAKARQALGAERDAYIEEQASIPWYEQALDMAKGIVRAPYVMVQGVTGDDPGGFGESVGRSSVPDAYAYATKPGEMVEASPVAAGVDAAGIVLPFAKPAKLMKAASLADKLKATRRARPRTTSLKPDDFARRPESYTVPGDQTLSPKERFKEIDRVGRLSNGPGRGTVYGPDFDGLIDDDFSSGLSSIRHDVKSGVLPRDQVEGSALHIASDASASPAEMQVARKALRTPGAGHAHGGRAMTGYDTGDLIHPDVDMSTLEGSFAAGINPAARMSLRDGMTGGGHTGVLDALGDYLGAQDLFSGLRAKFKKPSPASPVREPVMIRTRADKLGRIESELDRSLGGVHYVRHDVGSGTGGYVALNPGVNPPIPAMADAWKLGYKLDDNPIFNYNPADLDQIREYALSELRSPENLGKLSESIQSSGIREPLIVSLGRDGRATLVEGNHRHQVAMDAGLDSVPVRFNHQQAVPETSRERAMRPVNPETKVDVSQPMPQDGLPPAGRRGSATEAEMDALMDLLTGWGRK